MRELSLDPKTSALLVMDFKPAIVEGGEGRARGLRKRRQKTPWTKPLRGSIASHRRSRSLT